MLICLDAVEQNKPAILAEVSPNLVSVLNSFIFIFVYLSLCENELKLRSKRFLFDTRREIDNILSRIANVYPNCTSRCS